MGQKTHQLKHVDDGHWHGHGSWSSEGLLPALMIVAMVALIALGRRSGKRFSSNGYVLRRSKSGHDQYEHRAIAEEILGRRLETGEVVHHINGRRSDNRPENLCVMDTRDHDRYHEWYDWTFKTYGNYPRRETQLQKLREDFKGKLLAEDVLKKK